MGWVLSDPNSTGWAVLTGLDDKPLEGCPKFLLGYWPPSVAAQIEPRIDRMREMARDRRAVAMAEGAAKGLDGEALEAHVIDSLRRSPSTELAREDSDTWREIVRWSLRGWSDVTGPDGKEIPFTSRETEIDGRKHVEAMPDALWLLSTNRLLSAVGTKAALYNTLTVEEGNACAWLSRS